MDMARDLGETGEREMKGHEKDQDSICICTNYPINGFNIYSKHMLNKKL